VNTVILRNGKRTGHNTDWLGFRDGFLSGLPGASLANVVQLGAGGAGAAIAYALLHMGAGRLTIIDPCTSHCAELVEHYRSRFGRGRVCASTDIATSLAGANGLVHATPTGMASHPGLPLPASVLRSDLWVAEIVYFPLETELLRTARALGCRTLDGSRMAVHQAVGAFRLFSGSDADPDRMHQHFIAQTQEEGAPAS
jgi:shikimate dehydrogenase